MTPLLHSEQLRRFCTWASEDKAPASSMTTTCQAVKLPGRYLENKETNQPE